MSIKIIDKYFEKFKKRIAAIEEETDSPEMQKQKQQIMEDFYSILNSLPQEALSLIDWSELKRRDREYGFSASPYAYRSWQDSAQEIANTLSSSEQYTNLGQQMWQVLSPSSPLGY